jgi:predicted pyridoxine 5'-phosphate oxidase superfamily flavin-nucleotide-binding protein
MGIPPVIDFQVAALIPLGLAAAMTVGLGWRRRRHRPAMPDSTVELPGSRGEHELQRRYRSQDRASRFYRQQVLDRLNDQMIAFIGRQEMVWIATADGHGECDCSFRAGPAGFMQVLDAGTIRYPEYRGNGVMASLGNIQENPHIGMVFVDFDQERIGLHINGTARIVEAGEGNRERPRVERWVEVRVQEAYIHCRKHLPHLVKADGDARAWGTDDARAKGGDYFRTSCQPRPWVAD